MHGKSIELFLVNGSADSIVTAELSNWNGKAIKIPRIEVSDCKRDDIQEPGVYFLFCKDEENDEDSVYIGEAEIKKAMLAQADEVALLVDSSKFDQSAFVSLIGLDKVNYIITDSRPSDDWVTYCESHEIQLIY